MEKNKSVVLVVCVALCVLTGCAANQEQYFAAVKQQNEAYMQAYNSVANESVTFEGTFTGTVSIVKPKELPKLQYIEPPKSNSEIALQWANTIIPVAGMVAGMHFNYKAIDSSNKYNAKNIASWTGNFENNSVTDKQNTALVDKSNISVTDKSNISVTDTSVTDREFQNPTVE